LCANVEARTTIVIIGDRLRELREEKNLSQGDIEKRTGCSGVTSPALKMVIRFLPLKPWRSLPVLWRFPYINFSTKEVRSHPALQRAKAKPMNGAVGVRMLGC
jgi:hypothetical protein